MTEFKDKLTVSKPDLPDFDEYIDLLRDIWDSQHITNRGKYHHLLEERLGAHLGVENLSLACNGTIALQVALQALNITGEIITTPFTFAATTHAIHNNGCEPVFCDIDPETFCIDPAKLEALITPRTSAILPVHVYGRPCDVRAIQQVADAHGLKVIYDAAHAFGVSLPDGSPVPGWGDVSMLSFHATKVFNTIEGGALVTGDAALKSRIDALLNFGLEADQTVRAPGTNGKMNELSAAWGVLVLNGAGDAIRARAAVDARYRRNLRDVPGLRLPGVDVETTRNHSYFPIIVEEGFGISRDALCEGLAGHDILARRYFHPLTSNMQPYSHLPSAAPARLPVANAVAGNVLCLPIYSTLALDDVDRISSVISDLGRRQ